MHCQLEALEFILIDGCRGYTVDSFRLADMDGNLYALNITELCGLCVGRHRAGLCSRIWTHSLDGMGDQQWLSLVGKMLSSCGSVWKVGDIEVVTCQRLSMGIQDDETYMWAKSNGCPVAKSRSFFGDNSCRYSCRTEKYYISELHTGISFTLSPCYCCFAAYHFFSYFL